MKQILLCILLLTIVAGLAGCSGVPPVQGTITITFAVPESLQNNFEPLIAEFHQANPNVEIQLVPITPSGGGNAYDPLSLASSADAAVIQLGSQNSSFATFLDLTPLLDSDPAFDKSDFWPGLVDACQEGGTILGLPIAATPSLIFYDPAAFDAAGLPYPEPGWRREEFIQAARALTQRQGDQITRYGFVPNGDPFWLAAAETDAVLTGLDGEIEPHALAAKLNWYVDFVREFGHFSEEGEESLIVSGQAAMWIDTLENLPWRRKSTNAEIDTVPFPVPTDNPALNTTPMEPVCVGISAGTLHSREAWTWLKFLTLRPILDRQFYPPARPSVAEASGYWTELSPNMQAVLRFALKHAWYGSSYPEAMQTVKQALDESIAGDVGLEAAFAAIVLPASLTSVPKTPVIVASPQPTPIPGETTTIDYFSSLLIHPSIETIKALASEFNRLHPEYKVKTSSVLDGPAFQPVTLAEMAQHYDCFGHPGGIPPGAVEQLIALEPLLESEDISLIGEYNPALLDTYRIDGVLYALPAARMPLLIYYNVDLLNRFGLESPSSDWTADDFLRSAMAATAELGDQKIYGFAPYQGEGLAFLFALRGADWFERETEIPGGNFTDPEAVSDVAWVVDLIHDGVIPDIFTENAHSFMENQIRAGQVVFWTDYAGLYGGFTEGVDAGFQISLAPPPVSPGRLPPPLSNGLYISRHSEAPLACLKWLSFLSGQPNAFTGLPARESLLELPSWESVVGSATAGVYRAAAARPVLDRGLDHHIINWLEDAIKDIITGELPGVALAAAQSKTQRYLDCLAANTENNQEVRDRCAGQAAPDE